MSLIKWSPFFDSFEDIDKNFGISMPSVRSNQNFMPAIDMYEDKDNVIVETELSGIDPEKVDISIENNILSIKGEGEKQSEIDEKNYYRKEIHRGSFYRSIPLPTHVQGNLAKAEADSGVLKIIIPKAPEALPNKIKIETKN